VRRCSVFPTKVFSFNNNMGRRFPLIQEVVLRRNTGLCARLYFLYVHDAYSGFGHFLSFATNGMYDDGHVFMTTCTTTGDLGYSLMQRILVYIDSISVQLICWHYMQVWKSRASNIMFPSSNHQLFSCDVASTHLSLHCIALHLRLSLQSYTSIALLTQIICFGGAR
jgi:hypothetical protein